MRIKKSYRDMCASMDGGTAEMAFKLGVESSWLNNRMYDIKEEQGKRPAIMPAETALLMQKISRTTLYAEAVATESGGTFVKLPSIDEMGNEELFGKFLEANKDFGELAKEFQISTEDGVVDDKEWERLNNTADRLHRTITEFLVITEKVYRPKNAYEK